MSSSLHKSMNAIDPDERKKISQLQVELTSGGKDKVEWLYGGDKVDREAYLLGKPIDKLITEKNEDEKQKAAAALLSTVDLANKIREDPLFEIKKREIDAKKRLLENPVRFKQLKDLISKSSGKKDDERSYRSKEHKRSNRDRDEDSRHHHRDRRHRESRSRSRERERERDDDRHRHRSHHQASNRRSDDSHSHRREASDNGYGYIETKRRRSRSRSGSSDDKARKPSEKIEEINKYKKRIEDLKNIRDKKPSYTKDQPSVKKLSEEEKRRKLEEMTKNAQWRNELRTTNVKRYKDDDEKEDIEREKRIEPTEVFNDMMRDAYTSAADRIKSNVKNIQRGESAYDKNFARK